MAVCWGIIKSMRVAPAETAGSVARGTTPPRVYGTGRKGVDMSIQDALREYKNAAEALVKRDFPDGNLIRHVFELLPYWNAVRCAVVAVLPGMSFENRRELVRLANKTKPQAALGRGSAVDGDALEELRMFVALHEMQETNTAASDDIVTLGQAAALVHNSKRTLERWKLPAPDFPGGDGKAHRWRWATLRPALEQKTKLVLPHRFPGSHLI